MHVGLLILGFAAASGASCGLHAPDHGPSDGRYISLPSDGNAYSLEVTCGETFVLRGPKGAPVTGPIRGVHNWFLFSPLGEKDRAPLDAELDWEGFRQQYMEQHFKEHGFYPLVVPPSPSPPVDGTWSMMVAVRFRDHHYLVDLFARDAFCESARAGHQLKSTAKEHRVFKSRSPVSQGTTVSWDEFCASEWKPIFE